MCPVRVRRAAACSFLKQFFINFDTFLKIRQPRYTLDQFVFRRTGLPLGASGSLSSMFARSFQASSPRDFWKYWNPIFGYYLGKHIYSPLKTILPASIAIVITFLFSGIIHDMVALMVRGSTRFLFSTWFFFLSLGVLLGGISKIDLSKQSKPIRISFNLAYIILSLVFAYSCISYLG